MLVVQMSCGLKLVRLMCRLFEKNVFLKRILGSCRMSVAFVWNDFVGVFHLSRVHLVLSSIEFVCKKKQIEAANAGCHTRSIVSEKKEEMRKRCCVVRNIWMSGPPPPRAGPSGLVSNKSLRVGNDLRNRQKRPSHQNRKWRSLPKSRPH